MAEFTAIPKHRKRKRRRRQDRGAVTARLILDERVKGEEGILSEDLFRELLQGLAQSHGESNEVRSLPESYHIAISPKVPFTSVDDINWTIVPVRLSNAVAQSTIQFAPAALALQSFTETLQRILPSKLLSHSRSGIEVLVLDIVPPTLETIFVTLEGELAKRLENGEGTFHVTHPQTNGSTSKEKSLFLSDKLTSAMREAMGALRVIHTGDFFPLPLPPHPITHAPPPPAKVTLCEPVAQGILSPNSRIIISRTHQHTRSNRRVQVMPINHAVQEVSEADEDTANEQFFSARETDGQCDTDGSVIETETELSNAETDDSSDESMDDFISLQAPILPASNTSGISTLQSGTPCAQNLGRRTNGINTPGSVFSTFTAAPTRVGGQGGRLFKAQGLMRPLPEDLIHPAPPRDDDEEARVYVDVNSLNRIGCFSGDWVRLETAQEPPPGSMGSRGLGRFSPSIEDDFIWRPVKVYGLPEGYSLRPVTRIATGRQKGRRLSFFESQISKPSSSTVYLSPILLANLDSPPYLRLSPLRTMTYAGKMQQPNPTISMRPPLAREVTLLKILTPLSTERMLQTAFLSGLKTYFAQKKRTIKEGDLVGIPIDEHLGRTLYQASSSTEDFVADEAISNTELRICRASRSTGLVWFSVGRVTPGTSESTSSEAEDGWNGVASIDPSSTQMIQAGTAKRRLPPIMDNSWQYYYGLREICKSGVDPYMTFMPEPRPQSRTALRSRLRELIAIATSPRAIHLKLQPHAILLVSTQRNIGKTTVASGACADVGLHSFIIDAYDILSEGGAGGSDVKTEGFLKARAERAMSCGPEFCVLLIRHLEALTADRMTTALTEILAGSRVVIATTTEIDKVPDGIRGLFTHELEMNAPDEWEREGILRSLIDHQGAALAADVDLGAVAVKTAALVAGDLVDVVDRALVERGTRLEELALKYTTAENPITIRDFQVAGGPAGRCLIRRDFDLAVEAARKNFADAIGAPKIPNVSWDDVGGLTHVKDAVMETIQLPLERPELFAKGMKKRSGILFYGPPGTGKTLLAKAIATEFSLNFFSVKGPELLNMYIGESEANVRRVFQRARDARPCVVFFDELDSVAPKRGNQGDSGGVMDRIVSQLLAELDGMSDGGDGGGGVFVIGATNRPDLLDAALLRPGRFDKMLYLGVSDTHEKQTTIMEALTRKFTMSPTLSLPRVASQLPFTYTGADFYALCSDAMLKAVTRQASAVDAKIQAHNASLAAGTLSMTTAHFFDYYATKADIAVLVTEDDFLAAQRELIPSVSVKELEHYKRVREQFESVDAKTPSDTRRALAESAAKGSVALPTVPVAHRQRMNGRLRSKDKEKGKGKRKIPLDDIDDEEEAGENGRDRYDHDGVNHSRVAMSNGFQAGDIADEEDLY
ncbi:MAG: peroxisomal assembly protein [Claussenomyces sp. TS43310]|nr:MAG: peroxisomal assembly protein [Claussenomyces sp. TS43310]